MQRALERHERDEVRVIPIILRPIYWQATPLGKLQALPKFSRPITSPFWKDRDEAFFDVAEGIRNVVGQLTDLSSSSAKESAVVIKKPSQDVYSSQRTLSVKSITRICPSCLEEFYPGDCKIVSQITGEVLESAPSGWFEKQLERRTPKSL